MNPRVLRKYVGQWVSVWWRGEDNFACYATLRVLRVNRDELVSMSGRRVPLGQITSIEEVKANGS